MPRFNIPVTKSLEEMYSSGLLPQRNSKDYFYQDSSSRSNLSEFSLSSENRRILKKTDDFTFHKSALKDFTYDQEIQKTCKNWVAGLGWDFPVSSIKNIFTNHIFNYVYIWKDSSGEVAAYAICLITESISHVAYVFYNPKYVRGNLPIRIVLQTIIDSNAAGLKYCYLGRFSYDNGYYKRHMPGFEYYNDLTWIKYNKHKH